jgi:broad specificity phosphatase PhoE
VRRAGSKQLQVATPALNDMKCPPPPRACSCPTLFVWLQVALSARGWEQAVACGHSLRSMMEAEHGSNYKLFFMTSPYCRTRQTFVGIRQAFPDENFAGVQVRSYQPGQACPGVREGASTSSVDN